jgi:putative transposase
MPRKPRLSLVGVPCHIIQRGNDRRECYFETENYQYYLHCLDQARLRYNVAVHAYVLMTNHVHLLMTPTTATGASRVMQLIGNRYVQYINKKYRRTGTLWEGRHHSSLVESERYLLTCYRYIELNPVRAGMVGHPEDYRWSSYRHHACGRLNCIITDHPLYLGIAPDQAQRCQAYQALFQTALDDNAVKDIRKAAAFSMPLGDDRFKAQVEVMLNRTIGQAALGRPRLAKNKAGQR